MWSKISFNHQIRSPISNQQNGLALPKSISFPIANAKWLLAPLMRWVDWALPSDTKGQWQGGERRSFQVTDYRNTLDRHLAPPTYTSREVEGHPLLIWRGTHLPDQVLLGPWCCRQADAQHDGVGWGGEDAGNDGISHVEGQHGVNHEDNEEEEWHLGWEDIHKVL